MSGTGSRANDWQSNRTIVECNRHMFANKLSTDVTFMVGPERVPHEAHKYILISRSIIFYEMFAGVLSQNTTCEVELPDVDPCTFDEFLLYLYCDEVKVSLDNVLSLLYVAQKYFVTGLVTRCLNKVKANMAAENVCTIMEAAHTYGDDQLLNKCHEFILQDPNAVFQSPDFANLCSDCVISILKDDNLSMTEDDVFKSVEFYVEEKLKNKNVDSTPESRKMALAEFVEYVRFPLMTAEFFLDHVEPMKLLSQNEIIKLAKYIVTKDGDCLNFISTPRKCRYVVTRFSKFGNTWSFQRGKKDAITFTCSEDVMIVGFQVYGTCQSAGSLDVNAQLLQLPFNVPLAQKHTTIETDGAQKVYTILFNKEVKVAKDSEVALAIVVKGPDTFSGSGGVDEAEKGGVTFKFSDNDKLSTNNTDQVNGQIPALLFERITQNVQ